MNTTKEYILSYNAISRKIIHYSTEQQAQLQGVQYQKIEATDLKEAKETYREYYLYNHTEGTE